MIFQMSPIKSSIFPIIHYSNGLRSIQPEATWLDETNETFPLIRNQFAFTPKKNATPQTVNVRFSYEQLNAQEKVTIQDQSSDKAALELEITAPANGPQKIFLATELTGWNMINGGIWLYRDPAINQANDVNNGTATYRAVLILDKNQQIKFKFCAGMDWKFEELSSTGKQTENRIATPGNARSTYRGTVSRWKELP